MAYWNESVERSLGWVLLPSREGLRPKVKLRDIRGQTYDVILVRWPEETELWPREPIVCTDLQDARARARELLESYGVTRQAEEFEERPKTKPRIVKRLAHAGGRFRASVQQHAEDRFEVRYFVRTCLGTWPAMDGRPATEEWDLVRTRWEVGTFANSLSSAEEAALVEMDRLEAAAVTAGERPSTLLEAIFQTDLERSRHRSAD